MEGNIPTMASAVDKMDVLKKRDEFEQSKSEMLDKMSAEQKTSPIAPTNEQSIPEVVNTEIRDSKIGLIKMFIQLARDGQMDYEEVVERIEQVRDNKFISMDDANGLKKELDVAFGKTLEQIHDAKLGLIRLFIRMAKEETMEYEEVVERIDQVLSNKFISEEESKNLKHELDLATGRSTEQIHDAKLGLIRLFIKMAKENQMEYEEVLERIQQVKDNNFISVEDQTQLTHELDEALGRTPEQLKTSKLGLANLFISLYEKGQMEKDEVTEHIDTMLEKGYISKDDADSLRLKLEAEKTI